MKHYILYNPLAGHGHTDETLASLKSCLKGETVELNVTDPEGYTKVLEAIDPDDDIIISGGDGTINNFINNMDPDAIENDVYYYASGSGNDFLHDIEGEKEGAPIKINKYIKNLPTVTVKGRTYRFINGIGYGIDGYCCEVGDRLKAKGKNVDYTMIAIGGLLGKYKPRNAKVTVDGKNYEFNKVWIAPTMLGRFYGGGMMATPGQDRLGDGLLSFICFYGSNKFRTLTIFPSIFKGEHVKQTKYVEVIKGKSFTVSFDKPCSLQVDGETILDVTSYTVNR